MGVKRGKTLPPGTAGVGTTISESRHRGSIINGRDYINSLNGGLYFYIPRIWLEELHKAILGMTKKWI
jgi:hypothetical protein